MASRSEAFTEAIHFNPRLSAKPISDAASSGTIWAKTTWPSGDFEQASSISFEDVRPLLWLGFAEMSQENYIDAIRAYGKAINQDDRYTPAHVNRGLAYMQIEEYEKAVRNFNGAIRLEPTELQHFYKRGLAQMLPR